MPQEIDGKGDLPYFWPMASLTITARGQVTLRKDVLQHLGIKPGDKITVEKLPEGRLEIKAAKPSGKISDVFNMFTAPPGTEITIEEMNEVIRRGWAGEP